MPKQTRQKRVTLLDVAQDAGVSRATASLVLRGSPLVATETREQVLSSMQKLGYVYNRAAANLRAQRSQTVGLVITNITNPFFAELVVGIENQLDAAQFAVLLMHTSEEVDKQRRILEMMRGYQVDGLLLCPAQQTTPADLHPLEQWQLPTVLIARYLPDLEMDYVGANNRVGAQLATQHLLDLGHQRIAFLGGPPTSSARKDRLAGYQDALDEKGLPFDPNLAPYSDATRAGGMDALDAVLALPDPPAAALCYNDVVALGVMLGLQNRGLLAGTDFGVIGFDNIADSALWHPPLTTVAYAPTALGEAAVTLLQERFKHPGGAIQHQVLAPALVIRASCGAS